MLRTCLEGPCILIYDTESKGRKFIENQAAHRPGGAGVQAAQLLVDQKVNVLLHLNVVRKLKSIKERRFLSTKVKGSLQHNL